MPILTSTRALLESNLGASDERAGLLELAGIHPQVDELLRVEPAQSVKPKTHQINPNPGQAVAVLDWHRTACCFY